MTDRCRRPQPAGSAAPRMGAAPRTSAGRCRRRRRRLGWRLQGTPLRAARRLRPHTREEAPAGSQPRAPRPRLSWEPHSRPFSPGLHAPLPRADAEEGRVGGASRHEDTGSQSERARATVAAPAPRTSNPSTHQA